MVNVLTTKRAWYIWALAAGFFFAEYFARVAPSVMVPDLMKAFHVNAFSLGSLSAFFYYAYVSMQIPVGILVDRYGPHKLLTLNAVICGITSIMFAHANFIGEAEFARFFMGFSAAFAFVGALKLASVWFPAKRFGFLAGATQALGMFGAAVGEGAISVLVEHIGWRITMEGIGMVLLILGILIGLIVRDKPNKTIETAPNARDMTYSLFSGLWHVLRNRHTWINGAMVGFLYAPSAAFAELWGVSYLRRVYDLSPEVAATGISMIFLGWMIGSPLAGFFSDLIQKRKPVIIASAFLSLFFMTAVLYFPHLSHVTVFIFLFCYGLSNVGVATGYAVAAEINPKPIAGTSISFANMASVLIGALFQPIIGWVLDVLWDGKLVDGIPFYTAHDFKVAMLVLPVCLALSIVAACCLKESFGGLSG